MLKERIVTGYPSIDKPWLKYYDEEAINAKLPDCSVFELLYQKNVDAVGRYVKHMKCGLRQVK